MFLFPFLKRYYRKTILFPQRVGAKNCVKITAKKCRKSKDDYFFCVLNDALTIELNFNGKRPAYVLIFGFRFPSAKQNVALHAVTKNRAAKQTRDKTY